MIWSQGFTGSYYLTIVDKKSWRDIDRMEIKGGSIERSEEDLLESADVETTELPEGGEAWVRIWLDAEQEGVEHVPLFTGLTSAPSRDIDGIRNTYKLECYSVLKPIDDILPERGFYVPSEVQAPNAAARLLRTGIAPVVVAEAADYPQLKDAVIAESGETNLSLAEKVLVAIDWRIRIDGNGVIYVEPKTKETTAVFNATDNDVIELSLTDAYDWYSCPNVNRAISDDLTSIARDDDPESPLSTVSRGREIWVEESSVTLGSNESLGAYAIRRLKELQSPARTVSYTRRFDPDVNVGDIVRINHPEIDIDGSFRVTSQTRELSHGCGTSEEATAE